MFGRGRGGCGGRGHHGPPHHHHGSHHQPHQQHLPPPPSVPGYMYVPVPIPSAPVPEQPTVINNYIYHNTPQHQVTVVEDINFIDWVPSTPHTASSLSHRAVVAGREGYDGSPLWVIRAHHSGDLVPGKLAVKHKSAYIAHAGKEIPVHNFELLCAPSHQVRWLPSSNGQVPPGAIAAGNTHNREPLYVGRAPYQGSITPGKVHRSHGCMYMSYAGVEVPIKKYDVLCKIVG